MKKLYLTTLIIFCVTFCFFCTSAGAVLEATGPCSETADAQKWLNRYSAQARVEGGDKSVYANAPDGLLTGNYAFVDNSQYAWIVDERVDMGKAAYISGDDMYIPSAFAKTQFGITADGEYISISQIAQEADFYPFFDPIGFAMLSKDENAVDTNVAAKREGYNDFYTVLEAIGTITWNDVKTGEFDRDAYIKRWQELLTIPKEYENDADFAAYKDNLTSNATLFSKLNLDKTKGNVPFTDLDDLQSILDKDDEYDEEGNLIGGDDDTYDRHTPKYTDNLKTAFERLILMAQYYKSVAPTYTNLRDKIIAALEYLYTEHYSKPLNFALYYNEGSDSRAGWTVYQFEIPRVYAKVLCLMYDDLGEETVKKHANAILDRAIDPTTRQQNSSKLSEYYTNRAWKTQAFFSAAVLANDYERMNYAMRYLNQIFMVLPNEDSTLVRPESAFYEDGSMVFHTVYAYNHGYGDDHLKVIAEMLSLTEDTPFSIQKVYGYDNIYPIMEKSFFPFAVDNSRMHFVVGRGMVSSASNAFKPMITIIANAPEERKESLVKGLKEAYYKYLGSYINGETLTDTADTHHMSCAGAFAVYRDNRDAIWDLAQPDAPEEKAMIFHNMDRAMKTGEDYTACLAMSSNRIQKYEADSDDNKTGWYTGDGMLYIYTGDQLQYTSTYFKQYDPYRVPGTTVDETVRKEVATGSVMPNNKFAGGAADSTTAICGYTLSTATPIDGANAIKINGNKSYFLLDGKVICVGSGITGGTGNVCTVVDNRQINLAETE